MKPFAWSKVLTGLMAAMPMMAGATPLSTTIVNDTYWGYNDHGYGDVISSASSKDFFNIDHLKVVFDSNHLASVTVYTGFKEGDPKALGTQYGDLFIATGGWHPYVGTDPLHFKQDRLSNTGTKWNYVIDTSEGGALYGGAFSMYQSQDLMTSGTYREGQIVQRKTGGAKLGAAPVIFGTELYSGVNYNTITYSFDWSLLGIQPGSEVAFKWGMTCANDTIEGQAPVGTVPSTGTIPLMFAGMVAWGVWVRRASEKRRAERERIEREAREREDAEDESVKRE